jgi:hypothetical protein
MPVNTPNQEYTDNLVLWKTVRDCVVGEPAIKAGRETYLPKPSGKTDDQYERYAKRVYFSGFTGRTAEGLFGNIFSRPPARNGEEPGLFSDFLANVDKGGTSIEQFAANLCWDAMQAPWGGILVDHSPAPDGISQAEKEKLNLSSFMREYVAENVINWEYDIINDQKVLTLAVLQEFYTERNVKDEFTPIEKTRYRVLRLAQGEGQMIYTQQVYEKLADKDEYGAISDPFTPLLDGKPLNFIPFYPCPAPTPEKSMLLDLAYVNIGHYQRSADLINALHYAGMPMAYIAGTSQPVDKDGKEIDTEIGSERIMFLPVDGVTNVTPSAGYLEPSGAGMSHMQQNISAHEDIMAILGARIISVEKKGVETAEAARIHRAGENSVLGAFARNMSERLTLAARLGARWRGVPEEITEAWSIELNLDYEGDLGKGDEKKLGILQVDSKLKSRLRYLMVDEGMSEEEALKEIELIDAENKLPEVSDYTYQETE